MPKIDAVALVVCVKHPVVENTTTMPVAKRQGGLNCEEIAPFVPLLVTGHQSLLDQYRSWHAIETKDAAPLSR